jgi:hypothetical protein
MCQILAKNYADSTAIVTARTRLLRTGGVFLTSMPNMCGAVCWLQKPCDRPVCDVHVPLTAQVVVRAHAAEGLDHMCCDYFLTTNVRVVNVSVASDAGAGTHLKRLITVSLAQAFMAVLWTARITAPLPVRKWMARHVIGVAVNPFNLEGTGQLRIDSASES